MAKEKFCSPDRYSILIPYKDFVKLVEAAERMTQTEKQMKRLEEQLGALRGLYSELLEKVTELNRYI